MSFIDHFRLTAPEPRRLKVKLLKNKEFWVERGNLREFRKKNLDHQGGLLEKVACLSAVSRET